MQPAFAFEPMHPPGIPGLVSFRYLHLRLTVGQLGTTVAEYNCFCTLAL